MKDNNNKNFLRGFTGMDIIEDFPKKKNNELNPYTGISENDEVIKLEIGLPKFKKDDITVTIDKKVISIYGSKTQVSDSGSTSRRSKVEFKRSFQIPESISPDSISITHKEKILSVILPKNADHTAKENVVN